MTLKPVALSALALALAACAADPGLPPPPSMGPAAAYEAPVTLDNVRAVARDLIAAGSVANMVVGVSLPDGNEVWMREGTLAFDTDIEADEQSLYRIYSMTKPITGVAAAILIDDGTISLDQPVCDFIETFCTQQVLVDKDVFGETRAPTGPVTVRHLMTHTSGLGYSIIPSALVEAYTEAGVVPGLRRPNPLRPSGPQPSSVVEFAERVGAIPLRVDPGTEWHYAVGLDVLGAVIEKASGMPFEAFLKARLFDPLGMDDTYFTVPAEDVDRLTTNYAYFNGQIIAFDQRGDSEYAEDAPFPAGGAGLASTAEDYLRFAEAMANEGRVDGEQALPKSVVDFATTNIMPDGVTFDGFGANDQGFGAGGSVILNAEPAQPVGAYGWGGAAGTAASSLVNEDIGYVMMTQLMLSEGVELRDRFGEALAKDLAPLLEE
ncbi:MAG: serine hydrolase [Pacificimonas sp.]|jgi:CubicO group peptidase (beta-lactamase class C family)|nr:serine hydrolase [Pacificimonas sp.]